MDFLISFMQHISGWILGDYNDILTDKVNSMYNAGYSEKKAFNILNALLSQEASDILCDKKGFDEDRIIRRINQLPELDKGYEELFEELDIHLRKPAAKSSGKSSLCSYIFSVSPYSGCYRHIKIRSNATLEDLHLAIQDAFEFDNDHLYAYFMSGRAWDDSQIDCEDCPDITLDSLELTKGRQFIYLFDFGDEWRFNVKFLRSESDVAMNPMVIRSKGENPEQYPDYDDYDE